MTALAAELQTYFSVFARTQRDLSEHTITAYRDTWRLLLTFLADTTEQRAEHIDFDQLDAAHVAAFLDYLEHQRGNSTATRNARLSAIRAVLTHALPGHLDHAGTISQVLAIPPKRHPTPMLEFLTAAESDALIAAPDRSTWTGRRDHAILVLALQTGLRISELRSLTYTSVHLGTAASVTCTGKGRRTRATPLTPTTTAVLATYLAERHTRSGTALFSGPRGQQLSPDAFEHRLKVHATTAATACPSLADKHLTMHTLRHTAAMNLLAAGVDISVIALWLGHQHTHSTDAYLHADMTIKQKAIDRTRTPETTPGIYHPEPDILAWLTTL
ncbi:tyrosine-type recombinase/integrase [Gordonia rhizosphera]|uniref:Putative recombinase n=1 Tax=Gordonia rhizosphera NBRC 16068 TaxID=1108045 RepID=K6WNP9_9ACTN|nr:tyrosine-type recombinase/integrase [Gordonia rhizosphera]GAB93752.1 putative recombinase [Gordonia rhizosphera NBRC 16068]